MEKSGYGQDGIYRSLRPPILFPTDPKLSMIPFLFRKAAAYPNALALADADSGDSLTFSALQSSVYRVAHALLRLGISKGDVVLLVSPNSLHFPLSFLSVVSIGAIATTANPLYTPAELSKQAADCRPKLVLTVAPLYEKIAPLRLPTLILTPKSQFPPSRFPIRRHVPRRSPLRPERRRRPVRSRLPVRYGGAALLVRHDGGEQGRGPDAPELHHGGHDGGGGPGERRGGAEHVPLLPAAVPRFRSVGADVRAAAAGEFVGDDGEVRDGGGAAGDRKVPGDGSVRGAAGGDRSGEAQRLAQVRCIELEEAGVGGGASGEGCHGGVCQKLPRCFGCSGR